METLLSKGTAISFPPGLSSHSLTRPMSMFLKITVGLLSWIGGMVAHEYLSIRLCIRCPPAFRFSTSTSLSWFDIEDWLEW